MGSNLNSTSNLQIVEDRGSKALGVVSEGDEAPRLGTSPATCKAVLMPAGGHLAAPCILADRTEKPCRQRPRGSPGAIRTRPPQPPRKVGISFSEDDESPRLGTLPATCKAVRMARCRSSCRRDVRLAAWHMFVVEHSIQPSCMMSPLVNHSSNCFDNATKGGPSRYVAYTFRSHTFPKAQTKNLKNNTLTN